MYPPLSFFPYFLLKFQKPDPGSLLENFYPRYYDTNVQPPFLLLLSLFNNFILSLSPFKDLTTGTHMFSVFIRIWTHFLNRKRFLVK